MSEPIPRKTIYRLSVYLRCLKRLGDVSAETVSSAALATAAGVKPAQLRKDLAHLGPLGKRGLGYNVAALHERLVDILGSNRLQPVVLVGVGHLGAALMGYGGFAKEGFEIVAGLDVAPERARSAGLPQEVHPMDDLERVIAGQDIQMAILCVPAAAAQEVANRLCAAGIQAILNFAPMVLAVPDDVVVNSVNLAIELENLGYFIRR